MAMGRQTTPAQFAVHDNDTTIKYTAYTVGLCQNRKLRESTTSGRTTAAYPWPPLNSNCIQVMHCLVLGHVQCVICKLIDQTCTNHACDAQAPRLLSVPYAKQDNTIQLLVLRSCSSHAFAIVNS